MLWNTSRFLQSSLKRAELRRRKTKRHNSCWRKRKKERSQMTFHHSVFKFFHSLSPIPWYSFLLRMRKTLARMHAIVPLSPSSPSSSTHALQALKKDIHPHGSDMSIHIMSDSFIFSTSPLFRCYVIYHIQRSQVFSVSFCKSPSIPAVLRMWPCKHISHIQV
jgi:hypothetical protein